MTPHHQTITIDFILFPPRGSTLYMNSPPVIISSRTRTSHITFPSCVSVSQTEQTRKILMSVILWAENELFAPHQSTNETPLELALWGSFLDTIIMSTGIWGPRPLSPPVKVYGKWGQHDGLATIIAIDHVALFLTVLPDEPSASHGLLDVLNSKWPKGPGRGIPKCWIQ